MSAPTININNLHQNLPVIKNRPAKIVVIGNGIGGVAVARELSKLFGKAKKAEVTIIGPNSKFLFKPMLPDALNDDQASIDMSSIFPQGGCVSFVQDKVLNFDVTSETKKVITEQSGDFEFDYLVLAHGSQTNYFNIEGAQTNSIPLEGEWDLDLIRKTAREKLEAACQCDYNSTKQGRNLSFVIVGAGATGIELAFELKEYIDELIEDHFPQLEERRPKISVVEAMADILPGFKDKEKAYVKKRLGEYDIELLLNARVLSVAESGDLTVKDVSTDPHREFKIHTVSPMWVTGIKANVLNEKVPFEKVGFKNQLKVNQFLEIPNRPDVYAIGDAVATKDKTCTEEKQILPDTGQVAEQSGAFVAHDLFKKIQKGSVSPNRDAFEFKSKGVMLSTGDNDGLIRAFDAFLLKGKAASKLRKTVYESKLKKG